MRALLVYILLLVTLNLKSEEIEIGVYSDHYAVINKFAKSNQCPAIADINFRENQMLAEYLIFCNALKLAGSNFSIRLIAYPVSNRALKAVYNGEILATGFGAWSNDIIEFGNNSTYPILDKGKFNKGLYVKSELKDKLKKVLLERPDKLIAVANKNWTEDWKALGCTDLNLLHVNQYRQMFQLLQKGRAELLPLTFSAKTNFEREVFRIKLYPIDGVKINFNDSLNFAVNESTPNGKILLKQLNVGISSLKENGQLSKVYNRLGIINERTKGWKNLGCH